MREKIKIAFIIIIIAIVSLGIINLAERGQKKEISGNLTVWATNANYNYIKTVSEEFEKKNKKVKINIQEINSEKYYDKVVQSYKGNSKNKPDIVFLNGEQLMSLVNKDGIEPATEENIINTYNMNFSSARLQQVYINKKYYGVPFNSTPMVLYLRNDLLEKYGYNNTDINTWQNLISIGKNIYKKSKGKVKLLSGIGTDYNNLVNLLLMENMNANGNEKQALEDTNKMIALLKKENILAMNKDTDYAAKISSIQGMKDISGIKEKCSWTANNPPSIVIGGNKFYEAGGDNLVVLNKKNPSLSNNFITYITNNTNVSLEYTLNGDLFSSYLYTYKDIKIEQHVNNFNGKSPLVVMSNITEKALNIPQYDLYLKLKEKLIK